MDFLLKHPIFEYEENTLSDIRKKYNFDKPGDMDRAIDILENWLQKQEHFTKKDFSRDYLERAIISMKGSVEKTKIKIDKLCTMRTLIPRLFECCDIKNDFEKLSSVFHHGFLPKLTSDYKRIYIGHSKCNAYTQDIFFQQFQSVVQYFDHCTFHDYNDGYITIHDIRNVNLIEFVSACNLLDARDLFAVAFQGYALRIKEIHIITESKAIDVLFAVIKQFITKKILNRIHIHKTIDKLHDFIPKEMLPADYGGQEKPLAELCDTWVNVLSEESNIKYFKNMKEARTNELLRQNNKLHDDYLGLPGTFRTLNVD